MRKSTWAWIGILCLSAVGTSGAFSVRPGWRVASVKHGGTVDVTFAIDNDQATPQVLTCQVRDSYVLPENKAFPAGTWVEPKFKTLTVPAHGSRDAVLRVHAPKGATGELASFVSFIPYAGDTKDSDKTKTPEGTQIVSLISVSLYARIQGTEKGEAELGDVKMAGIPANPSAPAKIEASVVVKNQGNVHLRPRGIFTVFRKGNPAPLHQIDFMTGMPVFPRSAWLYQSQTPGTFAPGEYEVTTQVHVTPDFKMEKKTSFTVNAAGQTTNTHDIR